MSSADYRPSDQELVTRLIAGDERAFEQLADHHLPALYRFALRRLEGDSEATREVVQATVCRAIEKLRSYRGEAALLTWLCSICRGEIAVYYRRVSRSVPEVALTGNGVESAAKTGPQPTGPEEEVLQRETADLVHMTLDLLPPRYDQALEWKYLEGASVREIGRRLEIGTKAAESLLTRARRSFRDRYDQLAAKPAIQDDKASGQGRGTG